MNRTIDSRVITEITGQPDPTNDPSCVNFSWNKPYSEQAFAHFGGAYEHGSGMAHGSVRLDWATKEFHQVRDAGDDCGPRAAAAPASPGPVEKA